MITTPVRANDRRLDAATTNRRTFILSRGLEYFTRSELQMQIGHGEQSWPAAILKELLDNALDAAETAGIMPHIGVDVMSDGFTVRDNGPGIPASTIERSLDYMTRVSDKLGYVAPTRGRLGNAFKVVCAAASVAIDEGLLEVHSRDELHVIRVAVPDVERSRATSPRLRTAEHLDGPEFRLPWPDSARSLASPALSEIYKR